jgi:hypothetical protein
MFKRARVEKGSHAPKLIVNNSLGLILNAKINSGQPATLENNEETLFQPIFLFVIRCDHQNRIDRVRLNE